MMLTKQERIILLMEEMSKYLGRMPTMDETLDFINGTDEERLKILGLGE